MRAPVTRFAWPAALVVLAACDALTEPTSDAGLSAAAVRGQQAFARDCGTCHASFDAADLAFFNFTDTTIIRRALAHVDLATAQDIVAFVHTRLGPRASRNLRLFQPGDVVLGDDLAFATALFGVNQWPADLTTARLAAIDPSHVRAAVALPLWSHETSNVDWMPDRPLPDVLLDDQNGRARTMLASYRTVLTPQSLNGVVQALRTADRRVENPAAPCVFDVVDRVPDYFTCFEARRWTATLAAQHLLRGGTVRPHRSAAEIWWDVGNAARKAVNANAGLANGPQNWASWMYLGWIFEPGRFPSVYTGNGLMRLGLPRHATFVALRSQVARPPLSVAVYADLESAARFAPAAWTTNVARFGFNHLLERVRAGDLPSLERRAEARLRVDSAYAVAARKMPVDQRPALRQLADELLAALP